MPNKKAIKKTPKKAPVKKVVKQPVKKTVKKVAKKVVKSAPVKKVAAVKPVAKPVAKPVVTQKPKMVSLGRAIANFFKGYFNFVGTATRAEYWWMFMMAFAPMLILTIATMIIFMQIPMASQLPAEILVAAAPVALWWCWLAYFVWGIVIIIPMWSLMARRLHDAGLTAHLLWVNLAFLLFGMFMPFNMIVSSLSWVWSTIMFVFMLFPSKFAGNKYR